MVRIQNRAELRVSEKSPVLQRPDLSAWLGVEGNFPFLFQLFDVSVQPQFIDRADRGSAYFKRNPFVRFRDKKTFCLQVWVKPALRFTVGVRYVVTGNRFFPRQITDFRHVVLLVWFAFKCPKFLFKLWSENNPLHKTQTFKYLLFW